MGHVTWPRPFQGRSVIRRSGLAMFNPHTKFEMSTLRWPATKKWKATPNVKLLVLSHPFGDLGATHRVHLWLDGKRVVNFVLAILASSHGCGTAKSVEIGVFWGGGSLSVQILGRWGRRPQPTLATYGPLDRGTMLLQLCRSKFSRK